MPITRIGGQSGGLIGTTYALPQPNPVLVGTPLRVVAFYWATTSAIVAPAGWTAALASTATLNGQIGVWYRYHQAADASYNFTTTTSGHVVMRCWNLDGAATSSPVDAAPVTSQQSTAVVSTWSNPPVITTATAGAWVLWWLVAGSASTSGRTFTVGAGAWTPETAAISQATTGYMGIGAYEERATPGSTGSRTAAYSVNNTFRGMAIAIKPAPTTGPEAGRHLLLAA